MIECVKLFLKFRQLCTRIQQFICQLSLGLCQSLLTLRQGGQVSGHPIEIPGAPYTAIYFLLHLSEQLSGLLLF